MCTQNQRLFNVGVANLFQKQFQTVGTKDRTLANTGIPVALERMVPVEAKKLKWIFTRRFVSVCYYALTEFSNVMPQTDALFSEIAWVDIHQLPPLLLNYKEIIHTALETLRRQLHYEPIGMNLLPEKFTLPELQHFMKLSWVKNWTTAISLKSYLP